MIDFKEKMGGMPLTVNDLTDFRECIDKCKLGELKSQGVILPGTTNIKLALELFASWTEYS